MEIQGVIPVGIAFDICLSATIGHLDVPPGVYLINSTISQPGLLNTIGTIGQLGCISSPAVCATLRVSVFFSFICLAYCVSQPGCVDRQHQLYNHQSYERQDCY
jgi:hypothetical protein